MATALRQQHDYTPEEYLALEREAEYKSEYFEGRIYAMAGGSPPHSKIGSNTLMIIGSQLENTDCQTHGSDLKVRSTSEGLFSYPDVMVVCGEEQYHDGTKDVLINPKVIVEVLSPSTEGFDRGKKFEKYKELESFTDYILISQDEPHIDHYERQPDNRWLRASAHGLQASLHIASIDCTLALSRVYKRHKFPVKPGSV